MQHFDKIFMPDKVPESVHNQIKFIFNTMHNMGVIHLDANLRNILVDDNNVVKIIDFDERLMRKLK